MTVLINVNNHSLFIEVAYDCKGIFSEPAAYFF